MGYDQACSRSAGGGAGQADPTQAAFVGGADGGGQAFGDAAAVLRGGPTAGHR